MIRAMNEDVGPGQDGQPFITTVPMSDPKQLLKHATRQLRQSMQKTLTGSRTPTKKKSWLKPGLLSAAPGDNDLDERVDLHCLCAGAGGGKPADTQSPARGTMLS